MSVQTDSFPVISDDALEELISRIGGDFQAPQPYLTMASADSIRHFGEGIGDTNPLWMDADHAAASCWGGIIAPPTILYAFDRVVSGYVGGLPGIHAMFAGTDFKWYLPIREGDCLRSRPVLLSVRDMASKFSQRAVLQTYRVTFWNQSDDVVAEVDSWVIRTQRDAARRRSEERRGTGGPTRWTSDQIAEIAAAYAAEHPRGETPRFWEDVNAGDEIDERVKGPATVTSFIAFDLGWGGLYIRAHGRAMRMFEEHPALAIPNDQGVPEPPERVHWDSDFAQAVGVPAAYDYGPERISWLGHMLTDWIGDDGRLCRLNAQVRHHNIIGDLTRCGGRVLRKWISGDEHLVECEVWGENQRGERTSRGTAVVALPSRTT